MRRKDKPFTATAAGKNEMPRGDLLISFDRFLRKLNIFQNTPEIGGSSKRPELTTAA